MTLPRVTLAEAKRRSVECGQKCPWEDTEKTVVERGGFSLFQVFPYVNDYVFSILWIESHYWIMKLICYFRVSIFLKRKKSKGCAFKIKKGKFSSLSSFLIICVCVFVCISIIH